MRHRNQDLTMTCLVIDIIGELLFKASIGSDCLYMLQIKVSLGKEDNCLTLLPSIPTARLEKWAMQMCTSRVWNLIKIYWRGQGTNIRETSYCQVACKLKRERQQFRGLDRVCFPDYSLQWPTSQSGKHTYNWSPAVRWDEVMVILYAVVHADLPAISCDPHATLLSHWQTWQLHVQQ